MTDERPAHMTPEVAAEFSKKINGILHDLQGWQAANNHIADFRTTGMIQCLVQAAHLGDLLVRQDVGPEYRAALESFRVNVLDMDPAVAAQQRREEEAAAKSTT